MITNQKLLLGIIMKSLLGRGWLGGLEIRGGREKNLAFKGELTIWVYVAKRNGCGNGHFPSEMGIHKGKKGRS